MISAVVLTKNSQEQIVKCINSLSWCDEIVIVDDYSKDSTIKRIEKLEVEKRHKVRIYQRNLDNDFAAQRNFGLKKATNSWILFVDSDEVVSKELQSEIMTVVINGKTDGYFIKRTDYFLDRWLKYGETGNIKLLRLGKKGKGPWQGRGH